MNMNNALPFILFGVVFVLPGLVSLINNGEKVVLCSPANTDTREDRIKGIFNTLRAILIFAVLMVLQALAM